MRSHIDHCDISIDFHLWHEQPTQTPVSLAVICSFWPRRRVRPARGRRTRYEKSHVRCMPRERIRKIIPAPCQNLRRAVPAFSKGGKAPCLLIYRLSNLHVCQGGWRRCDSKPWIMKYGRVNRERRTLREIAASGFFN